MDTVDEKEKLEFDLPARVQMGLNIIQNAFDRKREFEVSHRLTKEENIQNFIKKYDEFVVSTYDDYGEDLTWREFKDLLLSEIEV